MIIDIHTHVFPDELASRAVTSLADRCRVAPHTDGTCDGLLASMRRAGVDVSAVMPIATKPSQVEGINRWAVEVDRREGIVCFGTLHPAYENWASEIAFLAGNGIKGVKFHPDYQEFYADDAAMMPVYRALADAGLVVLFHAGEDIGLPPPVHCTPDRTARVLDEVPNLTVIAAHMGGYQCWDDVERYLLGRELYLDTSYSQTDLGPERMVALIQKHGTERVLFGTDSPWTEPVTEIAMLRALPLDEGDIAAILGGNAARLLSIGK